jgi:hypothetical protein
LMRTIAICLLLMLVALTQLDKNDSNPSITGP